MQDAVKALLAAPSIRVKAKAVDDMSALHFAAQNGHLEVARMLITAGLPVNSKTRKLVTPLHIACQKGVLQCTLLHRTLMPCSFGALLTSGSCVQWI